MGKSGDLDPPGVHQDEPGVVEFDGPLDKRGNYRVILGGVGAGDENHVGVGDVADGVGHCSTSKRGGQTGHRGAVSETGAVINAVGFQDRPGEFLSDVVLLVGDPGRGEDPEGVRAVVV